MVLEDWRQLTDQKGQALSPALPVLFHVNGSGPLEPGDYVDGVSVRAARYWDSHLGWQPCVMVELGAPF